MDCRYLPDRDCRPWVQSRLVMDDSEEPGVDEYEPLGESNATSPG